MRFQSESCVTGFFEVEGHTEYSITTTFIDRSKAAGAADAARTVVQSSHRFSDFRTLHATLAHLTPAVADAFPVSRALFGGEAVKKERVRRRAPTAHLGAGTVQPMLCATYLWFTGEEAAVLPRDNYCGYGRRAAGGAPLLLVAARRHRCRVAPCRARAAVDGPARQGGCARCKRQAQVEARIRGPQDADAGYGSDGARWCSFSLLCSLLTQLALEGTSGSQRHTPTTPFFWLYGEGKCVYKGK